MTRHQNKASVDAGTRDLNSDEPTPRTRKPNGEPPFIKAAMASGTPG